MNRVITAQSEQCYEVRVSLDIDEWRVEAWVRRSEATHPAIPLVTLLSYLDNIVQRKAEERRTRSRSWQALAVVSYFVVASHEDLECVFDEPYS